MSIFEIIMLLSFGAAWPFSIYKSYTSRQTGGKSPIFMVIILVGYIAGILHKWFYDHDFVIYMYALNFVLVFIDLGLYYRNRKYEISHGKK